MPWVVGIDEAGYGPNLGPLVQAAVGLYLPDADPAGWDTLRPVVRRAHEKKDGRLLVDDSKKVYARGGLAALEEGAYGLFGVVPGTVESFLNSHAPACLDLLRAEHWFDPHLSLPVATPHAIHSETIDKWLGGYQTRIWGLLASVVTPAQFNRVCDDRGTKGAVLAQGLATLLDGMLGIGRVQPGLPHADEPVLFLCDKHGGRNYYAGLVQQAFPDGWVVAEREGAAESRYRIDGLDRAVTVVFRPRADGDSVAVALASMLCKYLREVCMLQFNRFWAKHVPGIRPTAGYPVDAKRFYAEIRPAMAKLGLAADQVWRKR